jgi:uncharacterized protein
MIKQNNSYLGTGWSFPPSFDKKANGVEMVSMEEDIAQSLAIYFSTRTGERTMRSDYGCFLYDNMFELVTEEMVQGMASELQRSIMLYEPRIQITSINASKSDLMEGVINIAIDYQIIANNNRINIVYPFYLTEGTNIKK